MPAILHFTPIPGPRAAVYEALTTTDGLQKWWTKDAAAEPRQGSLTRVSFYGGATVFELRVAEMIADEKLVWSVENGPPNWAGTTITWSLSDGEEGQTNLHLAHTGFAAQDQGFAFTNFGWGWYISSMLLHFATGTGMPHESPSQ